MKNSSYIPPLFTPDNTIILDPKDKANKLNSLFANIFLPNNTYSVPNLPTWNSEFESMESFDITSLDVLGAIASLKNTVSRTPDDIPCMFIKQTAKTITIPLTIIFNHSLKQGKIPDIWKRALVVPIFKKGQRNKPENYRPVSLTSVMCRIMEKIFHKKITSHLLKNQLLSNCQHGFLAKRSTLTQQFSFFEQLTIFQVNKINCHTIYLDFTKAFDKISHFKLLNVLKHFKINRSIINWTRDFLSNRTQQTVVENTCGGFGP